MAKVGRRCDAILKGAVVRVTPLLTHIFTEGNPLLVLAHGTDVLIVEVHGPSEIK